jgi:hypothetical protein
MPLRATRLSRAAPVAMMIAPSTKTVCHQKSIKFKTKEALLARLHHFPTYRTPIKAPLNENQAMSH